MAWPSYHSFWKKNYSELKVRNPSEDICTFCFKFSNRHKFTFCASGSRTKKNDSETNKAVTNETKTEAAEVIMLEEEEEEIVIQEGNWDIQERWANESLKEVLERMKQKE